MKHTFIPYPKRCIISQRTHSLSIVEWHQAPVTILNLYQMPSCHATATNHHCQFSASYFSNFVFLSLAYYFVIVPFPAHSNQRTMSSFSLPIKLCKLQEYTADYRWDGTMEKLLLHFWQNLHYIILLHKIDRKSRRKSVQKGTIPR